MKHLIDLGRRTATWRMAHFSFEPGARPLGLGDRAGFACPLSQHLLTFQKGRATFVDYDATVEFADFDRRDRDHGRPRLIKRPACTNSDPHSLPASGPPV